VEAPNSQTFGGLSNLRTIKKTPDFLIHSLRFVLSVKTPKDKPQHYLYENTSNGRRGSSGVARNVNWGGHPSLAISFPFPSPLLMGVRGYKNFEVKGARG